MRRARSSRNETSPEANAVDTINTHHTNVRIAGIATLPPPADAQLPDLLIADISTAQELFNALGQIDRIDVLVPLGVLVIASLTALALAL